MFLIQNQLTYIDRESFPQVLHLTKFVNIISIGVTLTSYIQLIAFVLEAVQSDVPPRHLVLPFILSGIPTVQYTIIFWTVFGIAIFWVVCVLWLLISASRSLELSSPTHAFSLDLMLTVLLPLLGNAFYLPILKEFFAAFACAYAPHRGKMTLIADPSITCWEEYHFILMACAFVGLCTYYPLVLRTLPLAQAMKQHYESYPYHIVYQPKYLVFEAQVKLLITLTATFFTNRWAHTVALGICVVLLICLHLYYKPCVSSPKVNFWRTVGYFLILCTLASGACSLFIREEIYIIFITTASWAIILFFAVFLHRATFQSSNILAKYKSITKDVRSEKTPLLSYPQY